MRQSTGFKPLLVNIIERRGNSVKTMRLVEPEATYVERSDAKGQRIILMLLNFLKSVGIC